MRYTRAIPGRSVSWCLAGSAALRPTHLARQMTSLLCGTSETSQLQPKFKSIKSKGRLLCLAGRMLDCTAVTTISITSIYLCKLALSCKPAENVYI